MLEIDVFTLFPHWFSWLSEEPRCSAPSTAR